MKPFGGFDHNAQSLRVVTLLESRYAGCDGLNLTWETLEGLAKHNGPLRNARLAYIAEYNDRHRLDLATHASAEAQVAALADDIAYHSHDLDDGLACPAVRTARRSPICRWSVRHWRRRGCPAWTCRRLGCATRRSGG